MSRALLLVALLLAGCGGSEGPRVDLGRAECAECRMVINDPAYMAMARAADGSELAFDALECLIKTQRRRPITGVLVSDFENPGTWIPAEQAVIARAGFPSPMGGGYAAFASPARAEAAVAARGGVLGSLADFVAGRVKEAP